MPGLNIWNFLSLNTKPDVLIQGVLKYFIAITLSLL